MSDKTERCPVHPEYNPYDPKERNTFNSRCKTCSSLFYATEPVGSFPGELRENGEGAVHAKYRIGPLTLEHFGKVRFTIGFHKNLYEEIPNSRVDIINRIIYIDDIVPNRLIKGFLELGCVMHERTWSEPPRITLQHFLYAIGEGFQMFWSTLVDPPKKSFIETVICEE